MITYYELPYNLGYQKEKRRGSRIITDVKRCTNGFYITPNDSIFESDRITEEV